MAVRGGCRYNANMTDEPPKRDKVPYAVAVILGRFLLGAGCGFGIWLFLHALYRRASGHYVPGWLFTWRGFLTYHVGCGLLCLFWPVLRAVAHGILRRLPFFSRYKWS